MRAQVPRTHQPLHEVDLVEADIEEIVCELDDCLLREVAPSIEIVAALGIAGGEVAFVFVGVPGEASGDRPQTAGVEGVAQHGVRNQPRDATVPVKERMDP